MTTPNAAEEKSTPALAILAAWVVVALPLGWGVYQSVVKSRPLFAPNASAGSQPGPTGH